MNGEEQNENEKRYPTPMDKLLKLGDPRKMQGWPDYLAMGFTREHIPDLIRMVLDEASNWSWKCSNSWPNPSRSTRRPCKRD